MKNPLPIFIQVILPLAVVWGVGYLGRRLLKLDPKPFSRAGLYLLTPAVIFTSLMESQVTAEEGGRIILVVFLLCAGLWLLGSLQAWLLRLAPEDRSAFLLTSIFINSVNYGFPAILLALGPAGLERGVIFSVGHAFLSNTAGVYIAARGKAGDVRQSLRQVLRIPMLYAVLLALGLRLVGVSIPNPIPAAGSGELSLWLSLYRAVKLLSQAAVPVFMIVLGMQLGNSGGERAAPSARFSWPMLLAGVNRLVLSPLLAWGINHLVGLEGLSAQVTILDAAFPCAVLMVILSIEFDVRPRFVSTVAVWTTLASVLTVTLLLSLWG
jgi:predicted permease